MIIISETSKQSVMKNYRQLIYRHKKYRRSYRDSLRDSSSPDHNFKKKKNQQDPNQKQLIINLHYCKYPLIKEISQEVFNMKVTKDQKNSNWDIFWSDVVS